jgi:SagB-type dehydrogenase family enzyme
MANDPGASAAKPKTVKLPKPRTRGDVSLEETLRTRRSWREFKRAPLTLEEISQLLWAAQGLTHPEGMRTAPSAGALYPLEIYVVAGRVTGLDPGVYQYRPYGHKLKPVAEGDRRKDLARVALDQEAVGSAPAVVVFTAIYRRTTQKYGQRGIRYVHIEAGHAAQNVCLQATALGLGSVVIGAFEDSDVRGVLGISRQEQPLYLLPVGRRLRR